MRLLIISPRPGAGADGFGGEEWLEHVRLDVRGNAGTVIHDFNDQLIVLAAGADANFAGAMDRVDGVVNEIGPNLIEFAAVSHDARDGAIERPAERHVFQFVAQHCQGALDAFMDVHLLHRRLAHVRVGLHGFDQFGDASGALLDLAEQQFQIQARFQPGQGIGMAFRRQFGRQFFQPRNVHAGA